MLMPPNRTRLRLTLASSGLVGVYSGSSVTSCPRFNSSTANALSREQLPQYIPAAPAVIERIFTTPPSEKPEAGTETRSDLPRAPAAVCTPPEFDAFQGESHEDEAATPRAGRPTLEF